MLPKIALLGRPNVGKSTLFNRLIRSNRAITHDRPGVTRDRMEGVVRSRSGRSFTLIDTGGVTLDSHHSVADGPEGLRGFEAEILQQTQAAMDEASVFCLVVDGRDGLMPFDEHLASFVRRAGEADPAGGQQGGRHGARRHHAGRIPRPWLPHAGPFRRARSQHPGARRGNGGLVAC